jgi:hypothetical protein
MNTLGLLFIVGVALLVFVLLGSLAVHWRHARRSDLFFSYRSSERQIVEPLADLLRSRGFDVWIDRMEIRPDERDHGFHAKLSAALQHCGTAVLFTSTAYCRSDFCLEEAGLLCLRFREEPTRIVEVVLEPNNARELLGLPPLSKRLSYLCRGEPEGATERLVEELARAGSAQGPTPR